MVPPVVQVPHVYTKDELVKKVYHYADIYGVNPSVMVRLISCENRDWNPNKQSDLRYKEGNRWGFPVGTEEKSYGLSQIHLPDNKPITIDQATDPDFSLDFMASNLAKGRGNMWTCYKNIP